jgi:hypothetical protein
MSAALETKRLERELLSLRQAAKEAAVAMAQHMPNRKETHDLFAVLTGDAHPSNATAAQASALEWTAAPIRTQWGDGMMVADVALDSDSTLTMYCHRDDRPKVVAAIAAIARIPA